MFCNTTIHDCSIRTCTQPAFPVSFIITSRSSLQSYHDPDAEEEDVRLTGEVGASASVTSRHEVSQPEEEKPSPEEGLEGEEKEDLPEQPPPVEEKPKESKD